MVGHGGAELDVEAGVGRAALDALAPVGVDLEQYVEALLPYFVEFVSCSRPVPPNSVSRMVGVRRPQRTCQRRVAGHGGSVERRPAGER